MSSVSRSTVMKDCRPTPNHSVPPQSLRSRSETLRSIRFGVPTWPACALKTQGQPETEMIRVLKLQGGPLLVVSGAITPINGLTKW